jgi:hypothetical protein
MMVIVRCEVKKCPLRRVDLICGVREITVDVDGMCLSGNLAIKSIRKSRR